MSTHKTQKGSTQMARATHAVLRLPTRYIHTRYSARTQGHSNGDELREASRRQGRPGRYSYNAQSINGSQPQRDLSILERRRPKSLHIIVRDVRTGTPYTNRTQLTGPSTAPVRTFAPSVPLLRPPTELGVPRSECAKTEKRPYNSPRGARCHVSRAVCVDVYTPFTSHRT